MDLAQIQLGRFDAESDEKLAHYFVETGAVGVVSNGKQLVLGRKGTGKTALFVHLKNNLPVVVVDLDLNEYLFSTHKSLRESGVAEANSYTSAWKLVIYTAILGSLQHQLSRNDKNNFTDILKQLQLADNRKLFAQIMDWLGRVKRVDLPNLGDFGGLGGLELDGKVSGFVGTEFIAALVRLEDLTKRVIQTQAVTVLIDRIDDVWDGTTDSHHFIVGALKAMRAINLLPRKANAATVILFLRTDIWQQVDFNDRNKLSQDIEYLTWADEELIEVIEARIASSLGREKAEWTEVFFPGEMRQRARSKTYMLKRTMGRPRDIVAYATFALEEAIRNGNTEVTADDIYVSEVRYSKHILDELKDEMAGSMKELPLALSIFKTIGRRNFGWDDWFSQSENQGLDKEKAKKVLTKLFEASVVGILEVGGSRGGSRSVYRYQDAYLQPHEGALMQVHLAVAKELGLKDS